MSTNSKNMKASSHATGGKFSGKTSFANSVFSLENEAIGVVNIPIIKSKDSAKLLPTYTAVLNQTTDDQLAAEDLDNIQLELETLLSNVALRYRLLKTEYDSLDRDEKLKDKKAKHSIQTIGGSGEKPPVSPATSTANGKRKRDDGLFVRKSKHSTSKHNKKKIHTKNSPAASHTDDSIDYAPSSSHAVHGQSRDKVNKVTLPKNDTPNKFWLSVEPYCMPLTNEDLRLLDDLLEQYNGPLVPPIPELGPHYSTVWAVEDLKEIQVDSNANNRLKHSNYSAANVLKKAESIMDNCVTGPLTQRLVSALIEEKLLPNTSDLATDNISSNSSSENTNLSVPINFNSLSMLRNGVSIENRIKKELIEQGILDVSDFPNFDEDQILAEIKKLISELSSIAEYNGNALKRLHEAAKEEIKRLEVKRKLDLVDQEILEMYKHTLQNKAKRKPLTNEEHQDIYRLTNEQKTLADQLERMQENCFLYE